MVDRGEEGRDDPRVCCDGDIGRVVGGEELVQLLLETKSLSSAVLLVRRIPKLVLFGEGSVEVPSRVVVRDDGLVGALVACVESDRLSLEEEGMNAKGSQSDEKNASTRRSRRTRLPFFSSKLETTASPFLFSVDGALREGSEDSRSAP